MKSGFVLTVVVPAAAIFFACRPAAAQELFNQSDSSATSIGSWYSDNWYQLGTAFSGTLQSLTLQGYVNSGAYFASNVYLDEFLDPGYSTLNQTYTLSDNAPFTPTPSVVTLTGLNVSIQPDKYYRLRTYQNYQNVSVILLGTNTTGLAMYDGFTYGVGKVYYYYTFYPYLVANGSPGVYQPNAHTLFYMAMDSPDAGAPEGCTIDNPSLLSYVPNRFGNPNSAIQVSATGGPSDQFYIICSNTKIAASPSTSFTAGYWVQISQFANCTNGCGYRMFTILATSSSNAGCDKYFAMDIDSGGGGFPDACQGGINGNIGQFVSSTSIIDGKWHNLVWVFDHTNNLVTFYLDGSPNGTAPLSDPPYTPQNTQYVGGAENGSFALNGNMDDFWIEDHAWTATEVASYYAGAGNGTISASTNLAAATFTITGPATFSGSGTAATFMDVPVGTYTISFGAVSGYTTPTSPPQTLTTGGTVSFLGTYQPVQATGTLTVTTNSPAATFTITGPATFTGSGMAATFQNAPVGAYTVTYGPPCRSDLPAIQTATLPAGSTLPFAGTYASPGFLAFPLKRSTDGMCRTEINAVFDHYQKAGPYTNDFVVEAYTGERGRCNLSNANQAYRSPVGKLGHSGFEQPSGQPFSVNGNYTGGAPGLQSPTVTCGQSPIPGPPTPAKVLLFYDGHPGYDFNASCGVPVYAAVDGTVSYPVSITYSNGTVLYGSNFHILQLTPDAPNGAYNVFYLHLSTYPGAPNAPCSGPQIIAPNTHVTAGALIGRVGYAGLCPGASCPGKAHLHFELQTNTGVPVDPYGWRGCSGCDPYQNPGTGPGVANVNLWQ